MPDLLFFRKWGRIRAAFSGFYRILIHNGFNGSAFWRSVRDSYLVIARRRDKASACLYAWIAYRPTARPRHYVMMEAFYCFGVLMAVFWAFMGWPLACFMV